LLATACGGTAGDSPTPAAATSGGSSSQQSPLAYAQCMRSQGVSNFPDPNSQGQFDLAGAGVDATSPQYQSANQACQSLLPGGSGNQTTGGNSNQVTPQQQAQLLQFSQCMRAHGVSNFPDPTSHGLDLGSGIDPSSPQFQAAMQACQSLMPNSGGGNQTVGGGGGS
jgi:hypothetical protein